jgi:hypothetical protein
MQITQQDAKRRSTTCSGSLCYSTQCVLITNVRFQELVVYILVFIHRLFRLTFDLLSHVSYHFLQRLFRSVQRRVAIQFELRE